ncbi:MAG: hypothetical protein RIC03_00125 [Cyclobacteriaceae bacterium]
MNKFLIISFWLLIVTGCKEESPKLTFERQTYNGKELRMDGFYYSVSSNFEGPLYNIFFYYRSGIYRYAGSSNDSTHFEQEGWLNPNSRLIWGLFKVDGQQILREQWTPEDSWIHRGTILNDTTFQINELQSSSGSVVRFKDDVFHFVEFSPKPDSITKYIE